MVYRHLPAEEFKWYILPLFLIVVLSCLQNNKNRSFPWGTPFPFNKTLFGELIYVAACSFLFHGGDLSAYFREVRKRVGDVFFLGPLFAGSNASSCICVLNPNDQIAIARKEKDLQWKVNLPDTVTAIHGERNMQNFPTGKRHAAIRKKFSSVLSPRSLESFTLVIVEYFQKMWNDLDQKDEEVKIQHAIRETQLLLMCKLLYGMNNDTKEEKKIIKQFAQDFELTSKALFSPGTSNQAFKDGLEAKKRIAKILDEKFDSIFEKRIRITKNDRVKKKEIGSAMEQIVESLIESGCSSKDEAYEDAKGNLYLLLEASHATTMEVTSSMIYFLNCPDNKTALVRAREESSSFEPTYENLKSFTYGNACIEESMRLSPISGQVGYYIPPGKSFTLKKKTITGPIVVIFDSSNYYEDEEVFDDSTKFKPERWLFEGQEVSKFARSIFHPFGFGRHICLGFPLAKLVMNANLYCFVKNKNRIVIFNESKVKISPGIFPHKGVCDGFIGKVVTKC